MRYLSMAWLLLSCMAWRQAAKHNEIDCIKFYISQVPSTIPPIATVVYKDGSETSPIRGCHMDSKGASKPEAVDVPAIRGEDKDFRDLPDGVVVCGLAETLGLAGLMDRCMQKFPTWTCADKKRVLQHDEQNPPKY